ncbi:MAG: PGF-CTERM sorting domain-containing protein [Halobacteriales archaeon]|nr:PGF-CTERM sorting domain-containing protein [Halobacteriales archaeon]
MPREALLLGGAAGVAALSILVAAVAPGVIAQPEIRDRPGEIDIVEVMIAPGTVSGRTATLSVDTRLRHRGGPSGNVSVLFRAIDLESGFVETERTVAVERVTGTREIAVVGNLSVERAGGYRIETIVFQDGARVAQGGRTVQGVGTLEPEYARTPIEFHRFTGPGADLPVLEYSIANTQDNRVTLSVSTHLTNTGDTAAGGLRLVIKARQADSNIVADETTVRIDRIGTGHTATPSTELTVPDGYDYYLDAILWKDGVIVGTARSAANLDPTETIAVNRTRRSIGLEVSDFDRSEGTAESVRRTPTAAAANTPGQPGFTPVVAVIALLCAAFLLWRRSP